VAPPKAAIAIFATPGVALMGAIASNSGHQLVRATASTGLTADPITASGGYALQTGLERMIYQYRLP
jgi:hypothetical protein